MPDDVQIPYGQHATSGRMLHVSAVPRGAACSCVCPSCAAPLISRQGERNAWHFAHQADDPNCHGALETALHKAAKQIIADAGWLQAPPLYPRHPNGNPALPAAQPAGRIALAMVQPEFTGFLPDFKPDLYAISQAGTPLIVEIHVAHAVDPAKTDRIRSRDIAAIEITLTGFRSLHDETWRDAVLRNAPRLWLHHPSQAAINAALAQQVAARQANADAAREAQAARQAETQRRWQAEQDRLAAERAAQQETNRQLWQHEWAAEAAKRRAEQTAATLAAADHAGTSQRCHVCRKPFSPFGFGLPPQRPIWACRDHRAQVDQIWQPPNA